MIVAIVIFVKIAKIVWSALTVMNVQVVIDAESAMNAMNALSVEWCVNVLSATIVRVAAIVIVVINLPTANGVIAAWM